MKIVIYSTKPYEIHELKNALASYDCTFSPHRLTVETAYLSNGYNCICVFTSDVVSSEVIQQLTQNGVKYVATRSAGFRVGLFILGCLNFL